MNGLTPAEIDAVLTANLTSARKAAPIDASREVLTLACPGSGRSRTLASRIARDPQEIVAFTFTEKAAEALKVKVAGALAALGIAPIAFDAMHVETIHSYCQYVLTQMHARCRLDVLEENRLKPYLISLYPRLGIRQLRQAFSRLAP